MRNWGNKTSTAMQKHKGVLLPARARAPVSSSAVESWREPRAQIYSSIYKFRTKTGSWQVLIGCRGFLVFTDWPVIIPLIGQSYHLSGFQSYHLSDWPELPSLEAPAAWLRDYFWPSAPLWACHGSGEVVTGQSRRCKRCGFNPWVRKIPWRSHSRILAWRIPWTEKPGGL